MSTLIPIPVLRLRSPPEHRSIVSLHLDLLRLSDDTILGRIAGSMQVDESAVVTPIERSVSSQSLATIKEQLRAWFDAVLAALDGERVATR